MYSTAFNDEIAGDRAFYKDKDLKADMIKEMAEPVHLPWFKKAYKKYAKGQRFADQLPGREKYAPLTLTNRGQKYKLSDLTHSTIVSPQRLLTQKMRQDGKTLADLHIHDPQEQRGIP